MMKIKNIQHRKKFENFYDTTKQSFVSIHKNTGGFYVW